MDKTEKRLLQACRKGDQRAFRDLVVRYQPYALHLASRLLLNKEEARDAVQESFIRVWHHREKIDPGRNFSTWLYRIVTNICLDILKTAKKKREHLLTAERPDSTGGSDPARAQEGEETRRIITELCEQLSPRQRAVFVLRDIEHLSVQETGSMLKMREGAVKSNLYLARRALKELLIERGITHV